jgi:hypothetical protein
MHRSVRPCLLSLTLAAFVLGCGGQSESDPRPINVKHDPRIKRLGKGDPNQPKNKAASPHHGLPQKGKLTD